MDLNKLSKWKCHKVVSAAAIMAIHHNAAGAELELSLPGGETDLHQVDQAWMKRFEPRNGGYFVVYEDGYTSFSPKAAFEGGYDLQPDAGLEPA